MITTKKDFEDRIEQIIRHAKRQICKKILFFL